jgi:hypothetical protein
MESKKMIVSSTMIASLFNIVTNYFFIDLFGYQAADNVVRTKVMFAATE